jgi:hypothetical protein
LGLVSASVAYLFSFIINFILLSMEVERPKKIVIEDETEQQSSPPASDDQPSSSESQAATSSNEAADATIAAYEKEKVTHSDSACVLLHMPRPLLCF